MKFDINQLLLDYRGLFSESLAVVKNNPEYADVKDHIVWCLSMACFVDKHIPPPGQAMVGSCMVRAILDELGFLPVPSGYAGALDFPSFEAWELTEIDGADGLEEYPVYNTTGFLDEIRRLGGVSFSSFSAANWIPTWCLGSDDEIQH